MKYKIPTYYEIKYSQSSKIFEAEEIKNLTPDQIYEGEKLYKLIVEKLEKGEELDEGILSGIIGGIGGALIGPALMKGICKVLGIDQKGHLGKLLTSRLVLGALGYTLGK